MALVIRLKQTGKTNRHTFRIVVTDRQAPRDGKYKEMLGWYNPFGKEQKDIIFVNSERAAYWIDHGAILSDKARSLLKKASPDVIKALVEKQNKKALKKVEKKRAKKQELKK
jgi:small subunit ribosomal protein S16